MKKYSDAAVVNANAGSVALLATLSAGNFNVPADVTNNATNLGWGDNKKIAWADVKGYTRTAYAAGTFQKTKIDFSSITAVVGNKYKIRLYQKGRPVLGEGEMFDKTVTIIATSTSDLVLAVAFYDAFLEVSASTDIVVTNKPTAGSSTEFFYVEGQFGTAGLEIFDMGAEEDSDANLVTFTDSAAFAQAAGTVAIVNANSADNGVTGNTYHTYEVDYDLPVAQAPNGHKADKPNTGVVYVLASLDAVFNARFLTIMGGHLTGEVPAACTAITSAADASCTSVAHGLAEGDIVTFIDMTTADADNSVEWIEGMQNVPMAVKAITSADVFTVELDTSGYTAACTGAKIIAADPYKAK